MKKCNQPLQTLKPTTTPAEWQMVYESILGNNCCCKGNDCLYNSLNETILSENGTKDMVRRLSVENMQTFWVKMRMNVYM